MGNCTKEQNRTTYPFKRRRAKREGTTSPSVSPAIQVRGTRLLRSRIESLLCLTDSFLGLSKLLICGPSRDDGSQFWATSVFSRSGASSHPGMLPA